MATDSASRTRWLSCPANLWLLAAWLLLVAHALYFNFVCDDAYISFVYARNFAEHGELTFNLGERVEGYTNFLWTVLLATAYLLGIEPAISSRILGIAFAMATLYVVVRLSERIRRDASFWNYLPALVLSVTSGFACWSTGGLETQLFTFCTICGLSLFLLKRFRQAAFLFALGALTRPEGLLVFSVVFAWGFVDDCWSRRSLLPTRQMIASAAVFVAIYAPYFAWRYWYYGWPFPNTYYVKSGTAVSADHTRRVLEQGAFYIFQWARQSGALFLSPLVLMGIVSYRRAGTLLLTLLGVYLAYVLRVGGDFMGLHRFVMPLFVVVAVLACWGLSAVMRHGFLRAHRGVSFSSITLLFSAFIYHQAQVSKQAMVPIADRGIDRPGYLKLYAHDRGLVGKALLRHMRPSDFSFVGGAGVQPYYARMRAIDVFGLVSEDIAHHVKPSNTRPGHQKWAPAALVLQYQPTFIFHCYALHAHPKRYRLCGESGIFIANGYEPVTIHVPGMKQRGEYYTFLKRKDRPWP